MLGDGFPAQIILEMLIRSGARGPSDSRAGGKTEKEVGESGLSGLKRKGENDAYFTWRHSAHIHSARRSEDHQNSRRKL